MDVKNSKSGFRSPFAQLALLAVITTAVAIYLVKDHIEDADGSFCDVGSHISCTIVRRSAFSELFNVPVAVFGLLFNVVSLFASVAGYGAGKRDGYFTTFLFFWNAFGCVFVFYLILAELYLGALCPMCTVLHVAQAVSMFIIWKAYKSRRTCPNLLEALLELKYWVIAIGAVNLLALIFFNSGASGLQTAGQQEAIVDAEFAKCITRDGWRFFGRAGCSWCAKQKLLFGETMAHIIFLDCGSEVHAKQCKERELEAFPTWVKVDDNGVEVDRWLGYASEETLQLISGCDLAE